MRSGHSWTPLTTKHMFNVAKTCLRLDVPTLEPLQSAILVVLWLQPNRLAHTKLVVRNRFIQVSDMNNPSLRKQETIFVLVNNPHHSASATLVVKNGFIQASDKNNQLPQLTTSVSVNNPQHPTNNFPTTSASANNQHNQLQPNNQTTNVTTTPP